MPEWRNWSGSVSACPAAITAPEDEDELRDLVTSCLRLRVVGAGHSFMPLCDSDDLLLRLDRMDGAVTVATDHTSAWVPAGWPLSRVTAELWRHGLSLANQGDIDSQTLAGAVATGTHGTGRRLGSLSTMVLGLRIMTATGEMIEVDGETDRNLFDAARLSLGLLGVVTAMRIAVVPHYGLRETIEIVPIAALLDDYHARTATDRHGEFFVFPYADRAYLKRLQVIPPPPDDGASSDFGDQEGFRTICEQGRIEPVTIAATQRHVMEVESPSMRSGPAFRVFPSERDVRFEEMEYHFPHGAGLGALAAVCETVRAAGLPVTFPLEFRTVAGDDIWLSPFKAEVNESVAFHQYAGMEWRELFAAIEPILRDHGGRPHWGKRHTLTRAAVDALYPAAEDFRRVRRALDPDGKFLNSHLAALLG